jgi:hypothetical protein
MLSIVVALLAALLVFMIWYPGPYRELSGGRELFLLVVSVDVICGPLLTMVLFNPSKPRRALIRDLSLVVVIQLAALSYGLWTVWQARPLFLVQEIDRFKVIAAPDLAGSSLAALPEHLKPTFFSSPIVVAIRDPKNPEERNTVLFESLAGGRDYAERPDFYLPYEGKAALKSLMRAKSISVFLQKNPDQENAVKTLAKSKGVKLDEWMYLPVVARQNWVALLDQRGYIQGFFKGDGF